jgi:hypothetical protein
LASAAPAVDRRGFSIEIVSQGSVVPDFRTLRSFHLFNGRHFITIFFIARLFHDFEFMF